MNLLAVQNLSKKIGTKTILSDISFILQSGDLLLITGANGSGKTTLLRMIAGLTKKSSGNIFWNGEKCTGSLSSFYQRVGFLGHKPMVYKSLTAYENLDFFRSMYSVKDESIINLTLKKVGLYQYRYEMVSNFSKGMEQRLAIARALIHDPDLILYDEPFSGLDSEGYRFLKEIIRENLKVKKIQIVVTHHPEIFKDISHQELKLPSGRKVERGTYS